ncbi:MAG TPA: hypothetical protein VF516_47535, partial [Kofleriaceae bacterium]
GTPPAPPPEAQAVAPATRAADDSTSEPFDKLPLLDGASSGQVLAEPLARPTSLGENTAVHMRLPPPRDPKLTDSLVRVVGSSDRTQLLFRSDALAQLGVIPKSPGRDFFTSFATLTADELAAVGKSEGDLASGAFGETTQESIVFDGRNAIGRTINAALDPAQFAVGLPPVAITGCPSTVVSTWQAWGKSLFITDPAVVMDPARTWDPCTGAGTQGGDWTFAHLMREMANGSSHTPDDFVQSWLSQWLNSYVVNGDIVPSRTQMFNQVIQPWAAASSVTATLTVDPFTGQNVLNLSGPLDLDIAPFSLLAIVNRIDLGETSAGGGGYSGSAGMPKTPGELRFIFGVVQPNPWGGGSQATCGRKPFTVIFEYGVPGDTCSQVVAWAKQWSSLQMFPGFTPAYLAQLNAMTESVVVHGAAPSKGNQNALNQIRTNEIALAWGGCGQAANQWELREFTLTNESLPGDPPASGLLRKHTVARTPDDATYSAGGPDPTINAFIASQVVPAAATPASCNLVPNYTVPLSWPVAGSPFRGGNSLVPPPFWMATLNPATPHNICARHQFSLNTCNGCHRGDTGTSFTHINPLSPPPAPLSNFLTGGGPGLTFNVADPQYGASTIWKYADLQRRLQRLFDLSHCTSCIGVITAKPALIPQLQALGPVPADLDPSEPHTFETGPITSLDTVSKILQLRLQLPAGVQDMPADFARAAVAATH